MARRGRRPPQEFIADITVADDEIRPVREAHEWSRDKLGILASYFGAYARACTRAHGTFVVDGMAGPGLYHIIETGEWLLGSTQIALRAEPAFTRVLAMDLDPEKVAAMKRRVESYGDRAAVEQGDVNRDLVPAMARHISQRAPTFVLLDPEGAELEWQTVRDVAGFRQGPLKAEILVLFATEGVNRMLPVEADIELHNEMRLNGLFPPDSGWRAVWEARRSEEITPAQARLRYVEGYTKGFEALGYRFSRTRPIERSRGGVVYHLVFATDHPAGENIMAHVFDSMKSNRPQLGLL